MGVPFPMLESYSGFLRDIPRHELPPGFLWDMLDWIPLLDGAARRRFGWSTIDGTTFSGHHGGASNIGKVVAYAPFTAHGPEVVAVSSDGSLFKYLVTSPSGAYVGAAPISGRPVFHREQLILMSQAGVASIYAGNGAALTTAATSPHAACGTVYGDYTVLANTSSEPQRAYFSAAGDPTTYDTTESWIDVPGAIVGCQGIRNALLLFTGSQIWRVRGDTPPQANIVGNLVRDHLYDTGLIDERSLATYGEQVIFANAEGVWITNGASVDSLTDAGGIATYWQSLLKSYTSSWVVAGGVYRGHYCVSIINDAGTAVDFLVCDLGSKHWFRFSGVPAGMLAHATTRTENLYFVSPQNGIVGDLSSVWLTDSTADSGGAVIRPSLETPFFRGFQHFHRKWIPSDATSVWQRMYVNVEAPGVGSALQLAYTTDPEAGSLYTDFGVVPASSGLTRARVAINPNGGAIASRGIAFKVYQGPAMNPTSLRVNDIELEFFTREGSR